MAEPRWAAQGHEIAFDDLVAHAAAVLQEGQLPAAEPTEAEIKYNNDVLMAEEDEFFEFTRGDTVDQVERAAVKAAADQRNAAMIRSLGSEQLNTILEKMKIDDRHKDHVDMYIQRLAEMWPEFARLNARLGRLATKHNPQSVVPIGSMAPVATPESTCRHCKMAMAVASVSPKAFQKHVAECEPKLIFLDAPLFALMIFAGTVRPDYSAFLEEFLGQRPVSETFLKRWLLTVRGGAANGGQDCMRAHSAQFMVLTKKNKTAPQIRDAMRAFACKHPECIFDNSGFYADKLRQVRQPFPLQGTREYSSVRWAWLPQVEECFLLGLTFTEAADRLNMPRTSLSNLFYGTCPGAYWPGQDLWQWEIASVKFGKPKSTFVRKANQTPTLEQMKARSDKFKLKFDARIEPIKANFRADNPQISPELLAELDSDGAFAMGHVSAIRTLLDAALPIP